MTGLLRSSCILSSGLSDRQPSSDASFGQELVTFESLLASSWLTSAWHRAARLLKMVLSRSSLMRSRCSSALAVLVENAAAAMTCTTCRHRRGLSSLEQTRALGGKTVAQDTN